MAPPYGDRRGQKERNSKFVILIVLLLGPIAGRSNSGFCFAAHGTRHEPGRGSNYGRLTNLARTLVIVGGGRLALVVDEEAGSEGRRNLAKDERRLGKVEAIGEVVGWAVSVAERR